MCSSDLGPTHGTGGEYHVSKLLYAPSESVFFDAVREKGLRIGDLNGEEQFVGFGRIDYNLKDGLRWGTYQAYIEPILDRANLKVYRYATVQKVSAKVQVHPEMKTALAMYDIASRFISLALTNERTG